MIVRKALKNPDGSPWVVWYGEMGKKIGGEKARQGAADVNGSGRFCCAGDDDEGAGIGPATQPRRSLDRCGA